MNKVRLEKFLNDSTYLSGRPNGVSARKNIKLDTIDNSDEKVEFIISDRITGIGVSFFLGLFSKSVKKFKEDKFREKYIFKFEVSSEEVKENILNNIKYGINQALDERSLRDILYGRKNVTKNE